MLLALAVQMKGLGLALWCPTWGSLTCSHPAVPFLRLDGVCLSDGFAARLCENVLDFVYDAETLCVKTNIKALTECSR